MTSSLLASRWFRISAVILVLGGILLVSIPFVIEQLAEDWLQEHGEGRVDVEDVDFNPFTGVLRFTGLDIRNDSGSPLSFDHAGLDLAWLPLFSHRIDVQSIVLSGFRMEVDNHDILRIGGITLPATDEDSGEDENASEWYAGIHSLTLENFVIVYHDPKLRGELDIDHLQLSELAQWDPEQAARVQLSGRINGAPLELDAELMPFASMPSCRGTLSLEKLSLADLAPLAQPDVEKLAGLLSLDGKFSVDQDGSRIRLVHDGALTLEQIDVTVPDASVTSERIGWSGNTDLAMDTAGNELRLRNSGTLETGKLATGLTAQKLRYAQQGLTLEGDFSLDGTEKGPQIGLDANIVISAPGLSAPEKQVDLLDARKLHIEKLAIAGLDDISAALVRIDGIELGRRTGTGGGPQGGDTFYRADSISFSKLSKKGNTLSIDVFDEQGVHAQYHRDKDGNWYMTRVVDVLAGEEKQPPSDEAGGEKQAAPKEPATRLIINRLQVGKGSTLTIFDEAVTPPYKQTLTFEKAVLEKLDSGKPEQPSPIDLEARIGKHARLGVKGVVKPMAQPVGMDIEATLYAVELPALSPYAREALGVVLDSGSLDVDLKLKSEKQVMDGKAVLKLHQLVLESVDTPNGLQSKIPVPLNVALDTLRDRNNTIELDIPIKGDANSPSFDVSDAISQALATGVTKGALTYLTMALQPYGALITAAKYAGEAATRVRLNPVEFEPGQAKLDDTDHDYLAKVAKILKDRPKVAIKLCGVAVQQDAAFFRQAAAAKKDGKKDSGKTPAAAPAVDENKLLELARQRAAGVKDYLVGKLKAPADHLVGCRPRLERDDAKAAPRTDLLI